MPLISAPPLEEFQDAMEMMPPPPAYEAVSMVTSTPIRGSLGTRRRVRFDEAEDSIISSSPNFLSSPPSSPAPPPPTGPAAPPPTPTGPALPPRPAWLPSPHFFYLIHNSHIFLCLNIILFQLKVA